MAYERDYKQERKTAIKRGETGCGSKSGDAQRHRARRKVEKRVGRKLDTDEHVDHKKTIKNGGGNGSANLRIRPASKNQSDGGKSGSTKGKSAGGKKGGSARLKKKPS